MFSLPLQRERKENSFYKVRMNLLRMLSLGESDFQMETKARSVRMSFNCKNSSSIIRIIFLDFFEVCLEVFLGDDITSEASRVFKSETRLSLKERSRTEHKVTFPLFSYKKSVF